MPMLVETMAEAQEQLAALSAVAVTVGPGAFTGIRIGLAAARGIALAANVPIVGVTTFGAVAEAVPDAERTGRRLFVLLDSKRDDVFAQEFTPERAPVGPPLVLSPTGVLQRISFGPFTLAGDGIAVVRRHADAANLDVRYSVVDGPVDARWVAPLAVRSLAEKTDLPPTPLYLRAPDVRLPAVATAASGSAALDR